MASGLVRSEILRAILRSACLALFATPTIVGGHGIGLLPAVHLLLAEGGHPLAWVPIAVVFAAGTALLLGVGTWRRSRTGWPLEFSRTLLVPTYPKLLFYGLEIGLLFRAGYELVASRWPLQVAALLAISAVHFLLCRLASRRLGRREWILPLAFPLPIVLAGGVHFAVPGCVAGLAGLWVGAGRAVRALALGAASFGLLTVLSVLRIFEAAAALDRPHVRIQGGIPFAVGSTVISLALGVACLFAMRRVGASRR